VTRQSWPGLASAALLALSWLHASWFGPSVPAVSWWFTATACLLASVLWLRASATCAPAAVKFTTRSTQLFCSVAVLAAIISALMGVLQFVNGAHLVPWLIYPSATQEVFANLRQRNQFASLMVMGWIAVVCGAVWLAPVLRPWGGRGYGRMASITVLMALLSWAVAASGSRTGLLQWLLASALLGWWYWRQRVPRQGSLSSISSVDRVAEPAPDLHGSTAPIGRWLIAGVVVLLTWVAVMPLLADAVGNPHARGLIGRVGAEGSWSRMALWLNTLGLIAQKPWLGWGIGELAYAHYSTSFAPGSMMAIEHSWAVSAGRFMEMPDNAHNLILHMAFVWGVPLTLAGVALVLWLVWRGAPWRERDSMRQMAWGVLLVIGIHSMLEYPLWYGPFFMTAAMCVGILLAPWWRIYWQNNRLAYIKCGSTATILGAISALSGLIYVAYDYHRVSQPYLQPHERATRYADDPYRHAARTWLFQGHAQFAELVIMPLPSTQKPSRAQAERMYELASGLMHFSPEPRVIERLIESSVVLGKDDVAAFHLARYREAWPTAYAKWTALTRAS
jgi:hypothetical protein